jgi:hypothetical protein
LKRIGLSLLLLIFFAQSPRANAYETSLLDIQLRAPYRETIELLKGLHGPPTYQGNRGAVFQTFKISKQNHFLTVRASTDQSQVVGLELMGDTPFADLDFVDQLNLGMTDTEVSNLAGIPSITQQGPNGVQRHSFPHSNFAIDTKNGRVQNILIFVTGGEKMPPDFLKGQCKSRHAIWSQRETYLTKVILDFQKTKKSVVARLDMAADHISVAPTICRKLGCRIFNNRTRQTSGGVIQFGFEKKQHNIFFADAPQNTIPAFDVVLGANHLFGGPIVMNFKHNYLCTPKTPLSTIAQALELKKMSAKIGPSGVRLAVTANGKKIPDALLDSSSSDTALTSDWIRQLKLNKQGSQVRIWGSDKLKLDTYKGPVTIEIPGYQKSFNPVFLAPSKRYLKIGNGFLADRIWGFDPKAGTLYYSP